MARFKPKLTPTGDLPQTQRYLRDEMQQMSASLDSAFDIIKRLAEICSTELVYAGYGGLRISAPASIAAGLDASWETIPFNETTLDDSVNVTYDIPNNAMRLDAYGAWAMNLSLSFEHNSVNSGRMVRARLRDIDTPQNLGTWEFGTGRNAEITTMNITGLVPVAEAGAGKRVIMQIGGGDDYSAVNLTNANLSVNHVGEFNGTISHETKSILERIGAAML